MLHEGHAEHAVFFFVPVGAGRGRRRGGNLRAAEAPAELVEHAGGGGYYTSCGSRSSRLSFSCTHDSDLVFRRGGSVLGVSIVRGGIEWSMGNRWFRRVNRSRLTFRRCACG